MRQKRGLAGNDESMKKGMVYLSVLSDDHYAMCLYEIVNRLRDDAICFVTLNKTACSLEQAFAANNVSPKNIFFIDAVSRSSSVSEEKENVIYVSSPNALTELSIAISEALSANAFDAIVLDSVSTLSIYDSNGRAAEQFIGSVIQRARVNGKMGVLTCLQTDLNSPLVQKSCMYVDEVIRVKQFHPDIMQRVKNNGVIVGGIAGVAALSLLSSVFSLSAKSPTGFAVLAAESAAVNYLLAGLVIAGSVSLGLAAYFLHKKGQLSPIAIERLEKIAPTRQNAERLKKMFRAKIEAWVNKRL